MGCDRVRHGVLQGVTWGVTGCYRVLHVTPEKSKSPKMRRACGAKMPHNVKKELISVNFRACGGLNACM